MDFPNEFLLRKGGFRVGRMGAEAAVYDGEKLCSELMLIRLVCSCPESARRRSRRRVSHCGLIHLSIVVRPRRQVRPCLASTTRLWAKTPRPNAA